MRKKTKEEFIKEANKVHSDKYDYSQTEYVNATTKVKIICPKHGIFEMTPHNHLNGQGCPICGKENKTKTTEQFINEAKLVHNNKYNYSLVDYKNNNTKVKIICPIHGIFEQLPRCHLSGDGCFKCMIENNTKLHADKYRKTTEEFIIEANKVHNNFYDYSLVNYKSGQEKVKIICPIHGVFEQTPSHHIFCKTGCPNCRESHGEKEIEKILKESHEVFYREYKFEDCKGKRALPFDFYLPEKNLLIEFNGRQHYKYLKYFYRTYHDFLLQKHHDWLKRQFAKKNNIKLLTIKFDEDISKKLKLI